MNCLAKQKTRIDKAFEGGVGKNWLLTSLENLTSVHPNCPNKYNERMVEFSLNIFRCSPKAYGLLKECGLVLPSVRTIKRYLCLVSSQCGIHQEIMYALAEVLAVWILKTDV